jgi:hypothetical protein
VEDFTETKLSLTTPVISDADAVFPGEHWYFYWKTSASLWESKIAEYQGRRIIVPLNWSFHSETGDKYDFAYSRPETDLKKLVDLAHKYNKEVVFFLPLTPVPFLANGGIPSLLARNIAVNREGLAYSFLEGEDNLNKLYSFYDPRVFKAFSRYVRHLGQFFVEKGIGVGMYGIRGGALERGEFRSFIEDRSPIFLDSFQKFLMAKKEENRDLVISDPEVEETLIKEFQATIEQVYLEEARTQLSSNWEGEFDISFLGADSENFFQRINGQDNIQRYSSSILNSVSRGLLPSSVLLKNDIKKGILGRQLKEVVVNSFLEMQLRPDYYDENELGLLRPLTFFEAFELDTNPSVASPNWQELGLWEFIEDHYKWCYQYHPTYIKEWSEEENCQNKCYFFHGKDLDQKYFHNMLKIFMNGGYVFLNRTGLDNTFLKKLETFFLENSLEVETVNFHTIIHSITLGEGRLIIFEGDSLADNNLEQRITFWTKIFETLKIRHLPVDLEDGVELFWRSRGASFNELNYEEVRRLSLYNPTSYKRKVKVQILKNFALMKVLDEANVKVQSFQNGIDIELAPEGGVSLDIGVFT